LNIEDFLMDITVALGGGGTRGAAHLGVLRVLEREGYRVRAIAGTSIGSLVGALYAKGVSIDEMEDLMAVVDPVRLYGWPLSDGPGLLGMRGIADWLQEHIGSIAFKDLKLPLAVVAVDLDSNREIILRKGNVVDAVLGSMAVPGIFPPKKLNEYTLIDGGVLDPVPVRAARALAPGLPVVAVSLMPPLDEPSMPIVVPSNVPAPIAEQITRLNITQAFRVFIDAVDIGQRQMTELRLKIDQPEVLIYPDVGHINILEKVDVHKIARLGERATEALLPELEQSLSLPATLMRQVRRITQRDNEHDE